MEKKIIFLISVVSILILIVLAVYIFFGIILWKKYKYLFKIVRKMENDKYLWPLSKNISNKIINNLNPEGNVLLIGVGDCGILDKLVKKNMKIMVIDSNNYLLDLAKEKYGEKCEYLNEYFENVVLEKKFDNIISTLPHKEFTLKQIEIFFKKYFDLCKGNIIFFESKMPHIKNTYNQLIINNFNQKIKDGHYEYKVIKKVRNIPPLNVCICSFIKN